MLGGHPTPHALASHPAVPVDQNGPVGQPPSGVGIPASGLLLPASRSPASAVVHTVPQVPQWSMLLVRFVQTPASSPAQWMSGGMHAAGPSVFDASLPGCASPPFDPSGLPPPSGPPVVSAPVAQATSARTAKSQARLTLGLYLIFQDPLAISLEHVVISQDRVVIS